MTAFDKAWDVVKGDGDDQFRGSSDNVKFIPWIPEAEGPNCFICGEPNPEMDLEGHDNICRDCEVRWVWRDDDDGYGRK